MKLMSMAALGALLLASACGKDSAPGKPSGLPDAAVAGGAQAPDAGAPGASAAVPITDWVQAMVDYSETSAPDTVEDKNIKDTEDPAAFDSFLK